MESIIIEEISRNHKLINRHKCDKQTVSIGRGYHNDIILSDPHICAEHLEISYDGTHWVINDLDSINGCFLENKKHSANQHIVNSGDVITLGKSQIRLVFPNHVVEPSITFSVFEDIINLARKPLILIAAIGLFSLFSGYLFYLTQTNDAKFTQLFISSITLTLAFALWPCGVALVSHLTKNEPRVWSQLGVSFVIFNLFWLTDLLENIFYFNTSSNIPVDIIFILPISVAFCLFWLNIYIGFHTSTIRRNVITVALITLFFGGSVLIEASKQPEFSKYPNYDSTIMTPNFLFTSGSSTEVFIDDANAIFAEANKSAKEKE